MTTAPISSPGRPDGTAARRRGRATLALAVAFLLAGSSLWLLGPGPTPLPVAAVAAASVDREDPCCEAPSTAPATTAAQEERLGGEDATADPLVAVVAGTLHDAAHAPIRGARTDVVAFVDRTGRRRSAAVSDEGAYALRGLDAGTYWVTATAEGHRRLEETVEVPPGVAWLRKDFVLQPAVQLRIHVTTPAGRNLVDALGANGPTRAALRLVAVATREPPAQRGERLDGNASMPFGSGSFFDRALDGQPLAAGCIGILLLDDDLPVCVSLVHDGTVLETQRVGRCQDEVTFVVPSDSITDPATIRARVVDAATGTAIRGARMMLRGGARADPGVATDLRGIATIERAGAGRFELQIRARGYETACQALEVRPGSTIDLATVALAPEVAVHGRVLGLEDQPLAAAFALGIVDPVDRSIQWLRHQDWSSGGDGTFLLCGLGRREYAIRTSNHDAIDHGEWEGTPWVSGNVLLDTRTGPIAGLEIRLRPATQLVLHRAAGGADGLRFRVVDDRGFELAGGPIDGRAPRRFHLPPGHYGVALVDARGVVLSECGTELGSHTVLLDLDRLSAPR